MNIFYDIKKYIYKSNNNYILGNFFSLKIIAYII